MRPTFAWDRAPTRFHPRVLPISLLAIAVATALSACGDSATAPQLASQDQAIREARAFTENGITYPTVSIQGASQQMNVGAHMTLQSKLATPTATWMGAYMTYTSSDPSVVSVSTQDQGWSSGDKAYITGVKAGTATVTAKTESGTAAWVTITVGQTQAPTGGGGYHEPSGMVSQINTGAMWTAPAKVAGASWNEGNNTFTNWSPNSMSSYGEWAGNISQTPGGSGLRVTYQPSLDGGYSPVRFGMPIANPGSGHLYVRFNYRLSPNWTLSRASGIKVMEPRTVNSGSENHVIAVNGDGMALDGSNMWLGFILQFAHSGYSANVPGTYNGTSPNPLTTFLSSLANVGGLARGSWHTMEVYCQPESPAGATNGQLTLWVDGKMVFQSGAPGSNGTPDGGVRFFERGESMGWSYLMFDPTYGGDQASDHPPTSIYWDIDQLYVSTK